MHAGIDDLRVDDDEMAITVVEGMVMRAKILFPKRQIGFGNPRRRRPVVGLVADVVVAGHQVEVVFEALDLFQEPRRGFVVGIGDGRHGMHQIADVYDEGQVAGIQIADHVAHPRVRKLVDGERRVAVVFAGVEVRVGDDTKGE